MHTIKIKLCISILLIIPICLCGCWNKTDLSEKSIISGVGIDRNEDEIHLTLQTVISEEITAGEEGIKSGSETKIKDTIFTSGKNIFDAARNFSLVSGRKGMWSHCEVIILGSDCAKQGIDQVLDYLSRDHEIRFRMWVLVSKTSAEEILKSKVPFESNTAFGISDLLESYKNTSYVYAVDLLHLGQHVIDLNGTALIPAITIDNINKSLKLDGTAVIKDFKLIDWIDKIQTRGYLWINGKVKSGIVNVEMDGVKHGIEIIQSKTKIDVNFENNIPIINVTVNVDSSLGDIENFTSYISLDYIESLEKYSSEVIKKEIESTINKSKSIDTDFIGFSSIIYKKDPKRWKQIEEDWKSIFPELKVNINVNTNIYKTGLKS